MVSSRVLHDFSYIGATSRGRIFHGFPGPSQASRYTLAPRESLRLHLKCGDLVSIEQLALEDQLGVLALSADGHSNPDLLGLNHSLIELSSDNHDSQPIEDWCSANGLPTRICNSHSKVTGDGKIIVLQAQGDCSTWLTYPASRDKLVSGTAASSVKISLKRANSGIPNLPPLLGNLREEFTVDRASARAYEVNRGEIIQIIDVEGQQCSDFVAFRSSGLEAGIESIIDSTATRSMVRGAYPAPGLLDKFFDAQMRPMLNIIQDTCGRHDAYGLACTARGYEERGFPGHRNCSDNISMTAGQYGVARRNAWPAINFFWSTWIDPQHHGLLTEESWSRPGDYVAMRALDHLLCVTTACPDDLDPINGWNPTEIHVRIYQPDTPLRRAVAYREKENAPMTISRESAFHPRTSQLTSNFAPARDLWLPVSYPATGTTGEYWACREKVVVQDMSSLRKYDIVGPDAERLLQLAMTRDLSKLAVWRGTYALICDTTGAVVDDGTLFRLAPDLFRWCCGTEESARHLQTLAESQQHQVRIHAMNGALPNLAVQGPKSRDLLKKIVFTQPTVPSLEQIKWFGVTMARLNDRDGIPFMLARSGYTGELGYELFCSESDAVSLWDALMDAGQDFGVTPMGGAALDTIRIEAGLAAAHAEFAPGVNAFEAGLGFAVNLKKNDFIGRQALIRNSTEPRKVLKGLLFDCDDVPVAGAQVFDQERPVGVVTSATRSPCLQRTIAMARLAVEFSNDGTQLEVGQLDGHMKRLTATVTTIPFVDPGRTRARA